MAYDFTDARQLAETLLSKTIPNLNGQRRMLKPKKTAAVTAPAKKKARSDSLEVNRPSNDPNRASNTIERTSSMSSTGSSQKVMPPCLFYAMLHLYDILEQPTW
jgi:hypothetical protein